MSANFPIGKRVLLHPGNVELCAEVLQRILSGKRFMPITPQQFPPDSLFCMSGVTLATGDPKTSVYVTHRGNSESFGLVTLHLKCAFGLGWELSAIHRDGISVQDGYISIMPDHILMEGVRSTSWRSQNLESLLIVVPSEFTTE
jgi:hypothetical protein